MTPMIDVVLLLLIFFMVTATFLNNGKLHVALPKASPQASDQSRNSLELAITADGKMVLNGKTLLNRKTDTIKRALEAAIVNDKHPQLLIRADAQTPNQDVVTALDAAGRAGISQVGIATTPVKSR